MFVRGCGKLLGLRRRRRVRGQQNNSRVLGRRNRANVAQIFVGKARPAPYAARNKKGERSSGNAERQNGTQMLNELISRISELTGAENVSESDEFRSVGIDSLTYVQLVVETEQKYNIEFSDDDLLIDNIKTIAEFIRITEEKCKKRNCGE